MKKFVFAIIVSIAFATWILVLTSTNTDNKNEKIIDKIGMSTEIIEEIQHDLPETFQTSTSLLVDAVDSISIVPIQKVETLDNTFEYQGLVELLALENSFLVDCKYATDLNFTGSVQYEMSLILLQKVMAEKLINAQAKFVADGYSLKIFDGYRPLRFQQSLYDCTPSNLKQFVAKPSNNALHCKGLAVDCTLVDSMGNDLEMPSEYDEFTKRAYVSYSGCTKTAGENRDYLIKVMKDCGFSVYSKEWWHFTLPNSDEYELLDITFTEYLQLKDE